ncbi:MAG: hypothetical protein AAGA92_12175 [Planctomycetota bacterium]
MYPRTLKSTAILAAFVVSGLPTPHASASRPDGVLTVETVDQSTSEPIAARMTLRNARGRIVRMAHPAALPSGVVAFDGTIDLPLKKGNYTFLIDAGPEFATQTGRFTIERRSEDTKQVQLERKADMNAAGWWAADLDAQLRGAEAPVWLRASGLSLMPLLAAQSIGNDCEQLKAPPAAIDGLQLYGPWASLRLEKGSGLLVAGGESHVDPCQPTAALFTAAAEQDARVLTLSADAWELPLWLAAGRVQAIGVFHRGLNTPLPKDQRGRPPTPRKFPGKQGPGRWNEAIYHHALNCGLRLPPFAASGAGCETKKLSGLRPGDARTYTYCDDDFSRAAWWDAFSAGRVVATNGPLLRTSVEGEPPGHVFRLEAGERRSFQIGLSLSFYREWPVEYLEIVRDGRVEHEVRLADLAANRGRLPPLEFDRSGWFLVRAVTNDTSRYRYATTGPYYVEAGYQQRISRRSVEFFRQWVDELADRYQDEPAAAARVAEARGFWDRMLERANAE